MTKEEFKKFKTLPREREYLESRIRSLEQRLGAVPIVKDKVQASEKEYPYLTLHQVVDAPDPRKAHRIRKELAYYKRLLANNERYADEFLDYLVKIEDARTRLIMTRRYLEGRRLKDVAIEFDMTEQWVMRIIENCIKNL